MKKILSFILIYCSSLCALAANANPAQAPDRPNQNSDLSLASRPQVTSNNVPTSIDPDAEQVENLALLCKIWGFIKYHHPAIGSSKVDMDDELCKLIPTIKAAANKDERNSVLSNWVNSFGAITEFMPDSDFPDPEDIKLMPDFSWMNKDELGDPLVMQLEDIRKAVRPHNNPYINFFSGVNNPDFSGEKPYSSMQYPNEQYRLLALFRYWNIIQYYFPNRHLIDDDWQDILRKFIPQFIVAEDEYEYKYSIMELWASIKDSHAFISKWDYLLYDILGYRTYRAPLSVSFIEGKAVITNYLNQSLGEKTGLLPGDIIEAIDGISIEDIVSYRLPITSGSNYITQLRNISDYLLMSDNTEMQLQIRRNGQVENKTIPCYKSFTFDLPQIEAIQTIHPDIAYIYPGTIKRSDFSPSKMDKVLASKGIIIDLRCYPNYFMTYDLGQYLMPEPTLFAIFTNTDYSYPGFFIYRDGSDIGKTNPDYYKGKIAIIVNEQTQSQSEFTAMAFKVAPDATVIGSTTAGADGDVSEIILPGDLHTYISGIGVYYPDGTETQRVGIVPDVEVKPTIEGIKNGIDEPLEKAIEIINNGTGIRGNTADNEVRLYPNPVTEGFYIKGTDTSARVSVADMQGRTVLAVEITGSNGYVNIESLSTGTYIVRIEWNNKVVQKKIVKM